MVVSPAGLGNKNGCAGGNREPGTGPGAGDRSPKAPGNNLIPLLCENTSSFDTFTRSEAATEMTELLDRVWNFLQANARFQFAE